LTARRDRPSSGATTKWPPKATTAETTNGANARRAPGRKLHDRQDAAHSASGAAIRSTGGKTYIAPRKTRPLKPEPARSAK
jgi:hypothetical protein